MKKYKYKINFKKVFRNIIIIAFITLLVNYFNFMDAETENKIKSVAEFSEYAKSHGLELTQENYLQHLNK